MKDSAEGDGGGPRQKQETQIWRLRDYLAAAFLFIGTAGFVIWQNTRVAVLWDLGYLLDTSYRIALGQVPYRDFPLVHAPLTFLMQAGIMRLAGRHWWLAVAYAAVAGGVATVMALRIVLRTLRGSDGKNAVGEGAAGWLMALALAGPLMVLGIYSVYPHPIYDCDCALAMITAVLLLMRVEPIPADRERVRWALPLVAGAASVIPLFFKQNMGLPFLTAVAGGVLVLLLVEWKRGLENFSVAGARYVMVLAGMTLALLAATALIAGTAGLANYVHWTVTFAAQRRLPGFGLMLTVYRQPSFVWTVPALGAGLALCYTNSARRQWVRITAFCLVAAPLAGTVVLFLVQDDADERADNLLALWPLWLITALVMGLFELRRGLSMGRLMPFFVLAAIHGTLLSQQLWGSTYALWPLLIVLLAQVLAALPARSREVTRAVAGAFCVTLLICGGWYAVSLERLSYIRIPGGPVEHARSSALRGMADRGQFLSNLDELVAFSERTIPRDDALLVLPGEDPFYFATGRTPQFPVTLFDITTDPYSPPELLAEARRSQVKWVIVKRALQLNDDPLPEREWTMALISREYALVDSLSGYDVYRVGAVGR